MELLPHLLEHALEDTIYLVPFLLVTYTLLELLEHKAGDKASVLIRKAGIAGPLVGALLGAVPQCGFSAAGSALYASRAITLGTLFAVFLSTSDEMLPLFIAEQVDLSVILAIIGSKVAIGILMGFFIDGALRLRLHTQLMREKKLLQNLGHGQECSHFHESKAINNPFEESHKDTSPDHNHTCSHDHRSEHVKNHAHNHPATYTCPNGHHLTHKELEQPFSHHHCHNPSCSISEGTSSWKDIFISAVKHTLQVAIIVYIISFVLVAIMEIAGEDAITNFLVANPGIAIIGSALVGLIPNCGASVVITQLYLDGMLGTGAMISGLLVSAGVGILVLFSENRRLSQNIFILLGLFVVGVFWGLLFEFLGIRFI